MIKLNKKNNIIYRKPNESFNSQKLNDWTFIDYYNRLLELAINMFEWKNLPDTVDERFLELSLIQYGYAVYFNDENLGNLALTCMIGGGLNVYRIPIYRRAYATNGYQKDLTDKNSVMIFNNFLHQPSIMTIILFAKRLTQIERSIDVNVNAQKTPVAILCDEAQRMTFKNLYSKIDGNEPVIFGVKNLDLNSIKSINTQAPYVADKLNILKRQIWNEALTFFGIENGNMEKRERVVSDEAASNLGGVIAQRFVALNSRRQAVNQINNMFGTDIQVDFRSDEYMQQLSLMLEPEPIKDGGNIE